ncbi:hypothetical protein L6164_030941 [Bauhinia variegata]|uniref:Uncharacterized protein n=1 Tax=Bauhinia variegata TaxID=167791 RepID=A0ACB9LF98_BAUVA|nr:hypothetical protein L6164_030941 [Bauhinia variegata]
MENKEESTPLLQNQFPIKRTGTVWTAVAHIVTGVIGSGVLSLAWSLAQLGWVAGPFAIILFAIITLVSAYLLCNSYRSPDPEYGPRRSSSYLDAVNLHLGGNHGWLSGFCVHLSFFGFGIAYNVTTAISIRAILKANCYHKNGHEADCEFGGMGLAIAQVVGNGIIKGSIEGISTTTYEKVWLVAQGLGDIAFSYPFAVILIEIQDTLKSPPPENVTMRKASTISLFVTTFFYLCCGCSGYAAFGDNTPGNLLNGFYEPYWLVDFANACIVFHLVGAYQVYSQPLFANVESWLSFRFPESQFVNHIYTLKLPLLPAFGVNLLRLCFRSAYVASTTIIAVTFPYFNQVLGVLGGVIFWPLTIYFPVKMYMSQCDIEAWTTKWILLQTFSAFCFVVGLFALVGSIEGIITARLS